MEQRFHATSYLSDVFRHIDTPVVAWDTDRRVMIVNEAFTRMSGHAEADIIGQSLETIFPEETRSDSLRQIEQALQDGTRLVEIPILCKEGGIRVGLWHTSTVYGADDRTPIVVIAAGQDITEHKRLDTQFIHEQKMEAIGTLTGGIAHDFNNVLQGISGYTQLLLMKKPANDPDRDYLSHIEELIQVASRLIRQLLIFSRKGGKKIESLDLNQEITRVMKPLVRMIPRMISVETHLSDDLRRVGADRKQIESVIMNLVSNARDAMPDGGRLVIETKNTTLDDWFCRDHLGATPGEYAMLTVSDNGCGMARETMQHIFEPFYTTGEIGRGTGLGLATVYGIVKDYNGYITCSSEPGRGSVFCVYFPALDVVEAEDALPVAEEPEVAAPVQEQTGTILVVDDEKSIVDIACDILGQYGYTTITAENGEGAIEIYEKERNRIALVLLDIGMPGMGGYRCFQELLRIDPAIKVIITTGYSASDKVEEMLETGAVGFIGKPYRLVDMVEKVKEAIDGG